MGPQALAQSRPPPRKGCPFLTGTKALCGLAVARRLHSTGPIILFITISPPLPEAGGPRERDSFPRGARRAAWRRCLNRALQGR